MKNLLSILLWLPALAVKLTLAAVGLVVVPFTHPYKNPIYGNREDPIPRDWFMHDFLLVYHDGHGWHLPDGWRTTVRWRVRDYIWRAIRNPVNNLRYLFEDWEPEPRDTLANGGWRWWRGYPNPDLSVRDRTNEVDAAWRFMRYGLFSEYWYLRYSERFDRYFEFRIGWKFSGVPGFAPTIQLRFGRT